VFDLRRSGNIRAVVTGKAVGTHIVRDSQLTRLAEV